MSKRIILLTVLLGSLASTHAAYIDSFAVGPQSGLLGPGDAYWGETMSDLDLAQVLGGGRRLTLLADEDAPFRALEDGTFSATLSGATPGSLNIEAAVVTPPEASSYEPAFLLDYDCLPTDWSAFDRIFIRFSSPPSENVSLETDLNSDGTAFWGEKAVPAGSQSITILFSELSGSGPVTVAGVTSLRLKWILPAAAMLQLRDIQVTGPPTAELSADLGMKFDAQYSSEGVYYNVFTLSLTNTGEVPIFALFIAPNQDAGYRSGGTMDSIDTDPWDTWSVAMFDNGWYMLNSGDQFITNLSDVPNTAGWEYGQGLGMFWNNTHNPTTHQTTNPLAPGNTLAEFTQYGVDGYEAGQTNLPYLTYMVAGFDGSQVVTKLVTWFPPAPTPITLSAPTLLGSNQFQFTINSAPDAVLEIWGSTNLNDWSSIGLVTNVTDTTTFTDPQATNHPLRFYRAVQLP